VGGTGGGEIEQGRFRLTAKKRLGGESKIESKERWSRNTAKKKKPWGGGEGEIKKKKNRAGGINPMPRKGGKRSSRGKSKKNG